MPWVHASKIVGSSPISGRIFGWSGELAKRKNYKPFRSTQINKYEIEEVTERLMVVDCKSVGNTFVGSNPTFFIFKL